MGKKIKIAYLASEYPAISHTFIFREIQTLREMDFDVKTFSIRSSVNLDKMTSIEKEEAGNTIYIKKSSLSVIIKSHFFTFLNSPYKYFLVLKDAISLIHKGNGKVSKGLAYFAEAGILQYWMKVKGIGHVHVHFGNPAATVAMVAAGFGSFTFSMSIHGPDVFYNVDSNLLEEKVKRAVAVRCISFYSRSQLMRLVPYDLWPKIHIVRCGIDPDVFLPRVEPNSKIPEILCLGRLVPAKGQHILLEAVNALVKRGKKLHLTIVGGGSDRNSLEEFVKKQKLESIVTFTGSVGQADVHNYYNKADIFVLASFAEGVPVVLMEAMAKEIVSVSTRITGIPELIDNGVDGILVTPSDVAELADSIEKLIVNGKLRQKLGRKGRVKVLNKYDLKNNSKMMADFFKIFITKAVE